MARFYSEYELEHIIKNRKIRKYVFLDIMSCFMYHEECFWLLKFCLSFTLQVASIILQKQKSNPKDPFASNWLERLRQIKRIRSKVKQEVGNTPNTSGHGNRDTQGVLGGLNMIDDFTDFVS